MMNFVLQMMDFAFKMMNWQPGADCVAKGFHSEIKDCEHYYEWNARVQITTWDPTEKGAAKPGQQWKNPDSY